MIIKTNINLGGDLNPDANPLITKSVNAKKIGWFAIHHESPTLDEFVPHFWRVTHIPSGRMIGYFFNPNNAVDFAKFLNSLKIDWRRIYGRKMVKKFIRKSLRDEIVSIIHNEDRPTSWRLSR